MKLPETIEEDREEFNIFKDNKQERLDKIVDDSKIFAVDFMDSAMKKMDTTE